MSLTQSASSLTPGAGDRDLAGGRPPPPARPEILPLEREAIDTMLKALDAASRDVEAQIAPYADILGMIAGARETLLELHGVTPAGRCVECDRLLFVGETGFREHHDDGGDVLYCAEHAPTYGDFAEYWASLPVAEDTTEMHRARRSFEDLIARRLAAGGSLADKRLVILD